MAYHTYCTNANTSVVWWIVDTNILFWRLGWSKILPPLKTCVLQWTEKSLCFLFWVKRRIKSCRRSYHCLGCPNPQSQLPRAPDHWVWLVFGNYTYSFSWRSQQITAWKYQILIHYWHCGCVHVLSTVLTSWSTLSTALQLDSLCLECCCWCRAFSPLEL